MEAADWVRLLDTERAAVYTRDDVAVVLRLYTPDFFAANVCDV